jgi:hypothetical protein
MREQKPTRQFFGQPVTIPAIDSGLHDARTLEWLLAFVIATLAAPTSAAAAQAAAPTIRVSSDIACPSCRLQRTVTTTLRAPRDSSFYVHGASTLSRDSRGHMYVTPLDNLGTLGAFDSAGRFTRVMGRKGNGPGEFRMAQWTRFASGDTLVVLDMMQNRLTVLSPLGVHVTDVKLPSFTLDFAVLPNGRYVINSTIGTAAAIGNRLHIVNSLGTVMASFGDNGRAVRPGSTRDVARRMAVGPRTLFSIPFNEYRIDEWSFEGSRIRAIERDAAWFERYDDVPPGRFIERPPEPLVRGLQVDSQGLIYVFVGVPDPNWRRAATSAGSRGRAATGDTSGGARSASPTPTNLTPSDLERFYDTIVEVIDPLQGQLLVSARYDEILLPTTTAGWAYRYRDDGLVPVMEVHQISLTRNQRSPLHSAARTEKHRSAKRFTIHLEALNRLR